MVNGYKPTPIPVPSQAIVQTYKNLPFIETGWGIGLQLSSSAHPFYFSFSQREKRLKEVAGGQEVYIAVLHEGMST